MTSIVKMTRRIQKKKAKEKIQTKKKTEKVKAQEKVQLMLCKGYNEDGKLKKEIIKPVKFKNNHSVLPDVTFENKNVKLLGNLANFFVTDHTGQYIWKIGDVRAFNLMFSLRHAKNIVAIGDINTCNYWEKLFKQYEITNYKIYSINNTNKDAEKYCYLYNYGYDFENGKIISKLKKIQYKVPRFDVTIMNPPYNGKGEPLYLQILDKAFENSTKTICICPSQWTYCVPANKFYEKYKLKFKNSLTDYINAGNEFEAGLGNNAAIYVLDKNANNCIDIEELKWTRFKNQKLTKNIYEKFIKYCNTYKSIVSSCKNEKGKYYVTLPKIRGHYHKGTYLWDWPTLLSEDAMKNFDKPKDLSYKFWSFNTVKECENFVSYLNNDIILFLMYITKTDRNIHFIHIENIPMLNTFTHSWTTNELAKEFGFTKEELEYIIEEMKPFGWKTRENNV